MAGFTQPVYKTVCVKVPEGIFLCETADLHSGRNFMQHGALSYAERPDYLPDCMAIVGGIISVEGIGLGG